jgi:putative ABC transport system permease protein
LRQELLHDPRNLEIIIYGNAHLSRTFFQEARQRPGVRFAVPKTRSINATMDLANGRRRVVSGVEIIPTGPGDPIIPPEFTLPARASEVLISDTVATKLNLKSGETAIGVVRRTFNGRNEAVEISLQVLGVIAETTLARDAIYASSDLLIAAEDFRDGYRVELLGVQTGKGPPPPRQVFANARIYADSLDDVAETARWIREGGIEVRTRAEEIENVRATDQVLSFVFYVVALIAGLGCALALGGALWMNVDRKRRDLALLRLFGFDRQGLVLIPLVQSLIIAIVAFGVAYTAYQVGAMIFNEILGTHLSDRGYVCRLRGIDTLTAILMTALVTLLAAAAGAYRARQIDPAESLREM